MRAYILHSAVRCGAGAGLNIEVCGAVRAPALDDGAVRVRVSSLRAVRLRAKLLGPRRTLIVNQLIFISCLKKHRFTLNIRLVVY